MLQTQSLPDSNRTDIQQRLLARQIIEQRRQHKLYSFEPNKGSQEIFFTAYYTDENGQPRLIKIRVLFGGNKYGKTTCVVVEAKAFMDGERVWMPLDSPYRMMPFKPPVHVVLVTNPSLIEEDVIPTIEEWFPSSSIKKREKNSAGNIEKFIATNGSTLKLMSYEQDWRNFEGMKKHLIIFNEPCPRSLYIALKRGHMASGGYTIFAMTLLEDSWMEEELIEKADGKKIIAIKGNTYENRKHLSEEGIQEMEATLYEFEKQIRMEGNSILFQGKIYQEFEERYHVYDPMEVKEFKDTGGKPPKEWTRYMVLDPHPLKPCPTIWAACDPNNEAWVYDEYPDFGMYHQMERDNKTIGELCKYFRLKELNDKILVRLIDNTAGNRHEHSTGITVKEEFANHGIYFKDAPTKPAMANIIAFKKYLAVDKSKPLSFTNHPRIHISKDCVNSIYGIKHFTRDSFASRVAEKREPKEKAKEKNKCFPDLFSYLCRYEPINLDSMGEDYIPKIMNEKIGI